MVRVVLSLRHRSVLYSMSSLKACVIIGVSVYDVLSLCTVLEILQQVTVNDESATVLLSTHSTCSL